MNDTKRFGKIYALALTLFAFAYLLYASFGPEPAEFNQRIIDTVVGFLLGSVISPLVGFFFGSSLGSREKQELLNKTNKAE